MRGTQLSNPISKPFFIVSFEYKDIPPGGGWDGTGFQQSGHPIAGANKNVRLPPDNPGQKASQVETRESIQDLTLRDVLDIGHTPRTVRQARLLYVSHPDCRENRSVRRFVRIPSAALFFGLDRSRATQRSGPCPQITSFVARFGLRDCYRVLIFWISSISPPGR